MAAGPVLTFSGGAVPTASDTVNDPKGPFCALEATTGAGLVKVTTIDGSVLTIYLPLGLIKTVEVSRVWNSVTAATGIVGYYPAGVLT